MRRPESRNELGHTPDCIFVVSHCFPMTSLRDHDKLTGSPLFFKGREDVRWQASIFKWPFLSVLLNE